VAGHTWREPPRRRNRPLPALGSQRRVGLAHVERASSNIRMRRGAPALRRPLFCRPTSYLLIAQEPPRSCPLWPPPHTEGEAADSIVAWHRRPFCFAACLHKNRQRAHAPGLAAHMVPTEALVARRRRRATGLAITESPRRPEPGLPGRRRLACRLQLGCVSCRDLLQSATPRAVRTAHFQLSVGFHHGFSAASNGPAPRRPHQ
jgi:hypothetical protein